VEHIVAFPADEERIGGFHFNARKYADDDLIVGSINPYELFLIFFRFFPPSGTGVGPVYRKPPNASPI
jgi:L-rhamnose isomerase/sugar isomerase